MKFKRDELVSLRDFISELYSDGYEFISYPRDRAIYRGSELYCFIHCKDAEEHAQLNGDWHVELLQPILKSMQEATRAKHLPEIVETGYYYDLNKQKNMNRNSLEAFREEAKALKVPQNMIDAAEVLMEKNVPKIAVFGQIPADQGMIDATIHIKQSGQSDFYYFNKFDLAMSKAKPLEKEHQYLVISPDPAEKDKSLLRKFDSPVQAMDYFKSQKGNAELAIGKGTEKDLQFRDTVATMKEGKVDYVKKEFSQTYYSPVIQNSHYVDRGKGFIMEQAANMLQGRDVFRDDLVSRAGVEYKAWNTYQFNEPKDKYSNYTMKQFGEGYGFDLKKELANYDVKEMQQPNLAKQIVERMENGHTPIVTVIGKDGQEKPLRIEAVPRYGNINLSEINGKPVKREEYQKEQNLGQDTGKGKSKAKDKNQQQGQEMGI